MCRMMAAVRKAPGREALEEFRGLAANGNVLPGNPCGHGDGWGFAGYASGALAFFEKSALSAVDDDRYPPAADQVATSGLDIVLAHLRKASKGDVSTANSHPFRYGPIAFCHNGGVRRSEEIPIYDLTPEGQTDSERFFLNMVGRLQCGEARTLKDAAVQTVRFIHEHLPYSSLCFFLSNGEELLAYRNFRTTLRPGEAKPETWDVYKDYYTLYFSPSTLAVSSQKIAALASDWTLMANGDLLQLTPAGDVTCDNLK